MQGQAYQTADEGRQLRGQPQAVTTTTTTTNVLNFNNCNVTIINNNGGNGKSETIIQSSGMSGRPTHNGNHTTKAP